MVSGRLRRRVRMGGGPEHNRHEPVCRRRCHRVQALWSRRGLTLTACRPLQKLPLFGQCGKRATKPGPFNLLYWHFLDRQSRPVLEPIPRMGNMYRTWDRMDADKRKTVLAEGMPCSPVWTRARWSSRRCLSASVVLSAGASAGISAVPLGVGIGVGITRGGLACFPVRPFPAMHRSPTGQ